MAVAAVAVVVGLGVPWLWGIYGGGGGRVRSCEVAPGECLFCNDLTMGKEL